MAERGVLASPWPLTERQLPQRKLRLMRFLAVLLLALTLPGFAFATPTERPTAREKQLKELDTARGMEVASVPAPVFGDGKLYNYFFLNVRIEIAEGQNLVRMRERVQFVRDALVRGLHKTSVAKPSSMDVLDEEAALAVVRAAAEEALGKKAVSGVEITFAEPLHLSYTQPPR